ncbi:DUF1707 domain-containing protein [Nonomuraea sp. NPDC048916]|uniref:DUF1707 SHOCT-like domain-containing protein n=1 Tax=Nonomuraea sp. NPDC048916 TaxID=3154232 RepID=UPI0033FC8AD0
MDPDDLRIGDAEREHTMAALREHFAQGRLDHEELDQRLDQALAARTAGDLARVTADLPGSRPRPHRDPAIPGPDDWHAAMKAQRAQLRSMRQAHRDMRREWHQRPHRPHRHHHRGPGPFLPILFVVAIVGLVFGGWGLLKVVLFVWIGAMIFSAIRRHVHRRS